MRDVILHAWSAIVRNPLRAALTVLGISIGVMAVVVVSSLGDGASDSIADQIRSLGSNMIVVNGRAPATGKAKAAQGSGLSLTDGDARAIRDEIASVKRVAPIVRSQVTATRGDRNVLTAVWGTNLDFFGIRNWPVLKGAAWTPEDERLKTPVCLVGQTLVRELWSGEDPVGQSLRVGTHVYRVIGTLSKKGDSQGRDQDSIVVTSVESARAHLGMASPGKVHALLVEAEDAERAFHAEKSVTRLLDDRHQILIADNRDFDVQNLNAIQEQIQGVVGVLTMLLLGVAGISLFAGGIGVMNIMLVTVAERTREIGVRMAIGARAQDMATQFLVESVGLTLAGGVVGVVVGLIVSFAVGKLMHITVTPHALPVLAALAISGAVGLVFGVLPARRAAGLEPMVALRRE